MGKDKFYGLSSGEVEERKKQGLYNKQQVSPSRSYADILRANLFTRFNAINVVLAALVLIAGSPKNALFVGVVITNTVIGVYQEVKSKKIMEKMSLLNVSKVRVVREGIEMDIDSEEIVLGDVLVLVPGVQIQSDCKLISGADVAMDEAILTGESDAVYKKTFQEILSGSFVVEGNGYAEVVRVGKDNTTAKIAKEAKQFKLINSEIQKSINKILKFVTYIIIPVGILLFGSQLMSTKGGWQNAIIAATAGVTGMIPQGLILLTSLSFAVGVIKLSKLNALAQELQVTEVLARVNTICIDKTGTITEGALKLINTIVLDEGLQSKIKEVMGSIVDAFPVNNVTQKALKEAFQGEKKLNVVDKTSFSSELKYSSVEIEALGEFYLGAPEMILGEDFKAIKELVDIESNKGNRVLLLANSAPVLKSEKYNDENRRKNPVALLILEDIIKADAPEIFDYFQKEKVRIKVISGDNPLTVSSVAQRSGIIDAHKFFDARNLPESGKSLDDIVRDTVVFGRVKPKQKQNIIESLKAQGNVVAMTGDGVNDVLALKESDCGIAMASGSDAAKAVAQLVLLDSSFKALPHALLEGRRVLNNLERVAVLYLNKTVYSIMFSIIFALLMIPYPLQPIQITLIGALAIGIPSFFFSLSPSSEVVKGNFLKRVISISLVNGVVMGVSTFIVYMLAYKNGVSIEQCRTIAVGILGYISLISLFRIAKPFNKIKLLLIITMIVAFSATFVLPITRSFFILRLPNVDFISISIAVIVVAAFLINFLLKLLSRVFKS